MYRSYGTLFLNHSYFNGINSVATKQVVPLELFHHLACHCEERSNLTFVFPPTRFPNPCRYLFLILWTCSAAAIQAILFYFSDKLGFTIKSMFPGFLISSFASASVTLVHVPTYFLNPLSARAGSSR
jgi:hypothetical protein